MKRQENVSLGNFSGDFDIFCRLLLFFPEEIFQKITIDLEAAYDLKVSKRTQKAVNLHPSDLSKAWEVKAELKVVVERLPKGLVAPSTPCLPKRKYDFFDFILKQQPTPRQVKQTFLVKQWPTG